MSIDSRWVGNASVSNAVLFCRFCSLSHQRYGNGRILQQRCLLETSRKTFLVKGRTYWDERDEAKVEEDVNGDIHKNSDWHLKTRVEQLLAV